MAYGTGYDVEWDDDGNLITPPRPHDDLVWAREDQKWYLKPSQEYRRRHNSWDWAQELDLPPGYSLSWYSEEDPEGGGDINEEWRISYTPGEGHDPITPGYTGGGGGGGNGDGDGDGYGSSYEADALRISKAFNIPLENARRSLATSRDIDYVPLGEDDGTAAGVGYPEEGVGYPEETDPNFPDTASEEVIGSVSSPVTLPTTETVSEEVIGTSPSVAPTIPGPPSTGPETPVVPPVLPPVTPPVLPPVTPPVEETVSYPFDEDYLWAEDEVSGENVFNPYKVGFVQGQHVDPTRPHENLEWGKEGDQWKLTLPEEYRNYPEYHNPIQEIDLPTGYTIDRETEYDEDDQEISSWWAPKFTAGEDYEEIIPTYNEGGSVSDKVGEIIQSKFDNPVATLVDLGFGLGAGPAGLINTGIGTLNTAFGTEIPTAGSIVQTIQRNIAEHLSGLPQDPRSQIPEDLVNRAVAFGIDPIEYTPEELSQAVQEAQEEEDFGGLIGGVGEGFTGSGVNPQLQDLGLGDQVVPGITEAEELDLFDTEGAYLGEHTGDVITEDPWDVPDYIGSGDETEAPTPDETDFAGPAEAEGVEGVDYSSDEFEMDDDDDGNGNGNGGGGGGGNGNDDDDDDYGADDDELKEGGYISGWEHGGYHGPGENRPGLAQIIQAEEEAKKEKERVAELSDSAKKLAKFLSIGAKGGGGYEDYGGQANVNLTNFLPVDISARLGLSKQTQSLSPGYVDWLNENKTSFENPETQGFNWNVGISKIFNSTNNPKAGDWVSKFLEHVEGVNAFMGGGRQTQINPFGQGTVTKSPLTVGGGINTRVGPGTVGIQGKVTPGTNQWDIGAQLNIPLQWKE